jgi:hypothetical protein
LGPQVRGIVVGKRSNAEVHIGVLDSVVAEPVARLRYLA